MASKYPSYSITVVDALTYAGNRQRLDGLSNVEFVQADITDETAIEYLVAKCDYLVHFAAETHVDKSIYDPGPFLRTNILGTEVLARLALKHKIKRFHHVSTDEVFGTLELGSPEKFNETTPYDPRSPYSASKAASDHIVRAYGETYGLPYTITNCSNNYGPYDSPGRIVSLFITNALDDKPLTIYGKGEFVRDYLFVSDHCSAIDLVLHQEQEGNTYCIGGAAERTGLEVAKAILAVVGKPEDLIEFVPDRPGHDPRYSIDASLIKQQLGWAPSVTFEEGIGRSINWYRDNRVWWEEAKAKINMDDWRKAAIK